MPSVFRVSHIARQYGNLTYRRSAYPALCTPATVNVNCTSSLAFGHSQPSNRPAHYIRCKMYINRVIGYASAPMYPFTFTAAPWYATASGVTDQYPPQYIAYIRAAYAVVRYPYRSLTTGSHLYIPCSS